MAMDSVLGQSYPNLELLVMDDGSTDGTPELLGEYSRNHPPERFRFSRHENMGQARTLNRGYEMARGEILGYLSDDDLLARGAVARLIAELREHPDAVAVYPGYRMIDTDGEIVDTVRPIEYSPVEAFRLHDTIIGPGGLVRREVLEATGGWEENWHWMGDLILWMRVGLAGSVIRVEHPVASWRRHPGGITIETSLERARQHLQLVDVGAELLELPADAVGLRAEALPGSGTATSWMSAPPRPPGCGGSWLPWSSRSSIGGPARDARLRLRAQAWTPRCGACEMWARSPVRMGPSPTPPTARCSRRSGRRRTTACRMSTSSRRATCWSTGAGRR